MAQHNKIIAVIDTPNQEDAFHIVDTLKDFVGCFKFGLTYFLAQGPHGLLKMKEKLGDFPIFLDLKLHDISHQVENAVESILPLEPTFLTIHSSGGADMMRRAVEKVTTYNVDTKILAVTVLTSLTETDMSAVGQDNDIEAQVKRLGLLAEASGCHGLVCSPLEIEPLRAVLKKETLLVTPGIRMKDDANDDQKRIMTPKEALMAGADYLVIGRSITKAPSMVEAVKAINNHMVA